MKNYVRLGEGTFLTVQPYFNKKHAHQSIEFQESLGGQLPTGTLVMLCNEANADITTEEFSVELKLSSGSIIEFSASVVKRSFGQGQLVITFIVSTKSFYSDNIVVNYKGLNNCINSIYKGTKIFQSNSDQFEELDINQVCQSNYQLLKKLMRGYKKDTIFGFRVDGLVLTNTNSSKSDSVIKLGDDHSMNFNPTSLLSKFYDKDTSFEDFYDKSSVVYSSNYQIHEASYKDFMDNFYYNYKFYSSEILSLNLSTDFLFNKGSKVGYKLGDKVDLITEKYNVKPFIVSKVITSINQFKLNRSVLISKYDG